MGQEGETLAELGLGKYFPALSFCQDLKWGEIANRFPQMPSSKPVVTARKRACIKSVYREELGWLILCLKLEQAAGE